MRSTYGYLGGIVRNTLVTIFDWSTLLGLEGRFVAPKARQDLAISQPQI